ncbi:MAG: lytic transglycosylase domain-containing protein, partial [Sphingomonadales bacterium]
PATAEPGRGWAPFVTEASRRFAIPESWIMRVIRAESAGMTQLGGTPIRSRVGAMGLMQLMPGTWATMRQNHGLGLNPDDPRDNILAGTAYLRMMYDRFGYPGLFGAYNAGPARYAAHRATGRTLPEETRLYMAKVGGEPPIAAPPILPDGIVRAVYEAPPPTVFALSTSGSTAAPSANGAMEASPALFAIRKDGP